MGTFFTAAKWRAISSADPLTEVLLNGRLSLVTTIQAAVWVEINTDVPVQTIVFCPLPLSVEHIQEVDCSPHSEGEGSAFLIFKLF